MVEHFRLLKKVFKIPRAKILKTFEKKEKGSRKVGTRNLHRRNQIIMNEDIYHPNQSIFGIPFYSKMLTSIPPLKLYELYKYQYQYRFIIF
jgi:hypothetical protein